MEEKNKKTFENRSDFTNKTNNASKNICVSCDEPLVFALEDKTHAFSMGLFTILKCLKIAEKEGAIPELQGDWWLALELRYNFNLHLLE